MFIHAQKTKETKPSLYKTIDSSELKKLDLSAPHTVHCLGSGEIMISCLGNAKGELPGGFALLNENFEIIGRWNEGNNPPSVQFYYDFWYKPKYNIMVSSFNPNDVDLNKYVTLLSESDYQDNRPLNGGPQMIQLLPDGKRLYVTNSLFSSWDDQFYPGIKKDGSYLVKIDCDNENGGMKFDQNFYISFKNEPNGPAHTHEVCYPGGDATSTSDRWN